MDENPKLLKMHFIKKIKVSWIFRGLLLLFIVDVSTFAQTKCGISVPEKLVYIGKYIENNEIASSLPENIVKIPIVNSKDSLRYIDWTLSDETYFKIDPTTNIPNFDLNNYSISNQEIKRIELRGTCGVTASDNFLIEVTLFPGVHPRNAVTGNSDSINDFWDIINLNKYASPLPIVKVFDRWGNMVFESRDGYKQHKFTGIDMSGTKFLNTGTFVYSIIPHPDYPEIIGELTLIR